MDQRPVLLLTGGTGFVGRRLAPQLATAFPDHERVAIVHGDQPPIAGFRSCALDLTDAPALRREIGRTPPALVVHLAAQASVGAGLAAAHATWSVNVGATMTLAGALAEFAPGVRVLFASTGEVYGASFRAGPADEETPASPLSSYAVSKLAGERILADLLPPSAGLIITRALNHSGPGQDERFVLPSWAGQIARAEAKLAPPVLKVGNLEAARDFLHVDDVVNAYGILLSAASRLANREVFNLCAGRTVPLRDLLARLLARARVEISVETDPSRLRPSDVPIASAIPAKLSAAVGWRPTRSIDDMLDGLLEAARRRVG